MLRGKDCEPGELAAAVKMESTYRTRLMEKFSLSTNSDLTYCAFDNRLIS